MSNSFFAAALNPSLRLQLPVLLQKTLLLLRVLLWKSRQRNKPRQLLCKCHLCHQQATWLAELLVAAGASARGLLVGLLDVSLLVPQAPPVMAQALIREALTALQASTTYMKHDCTVLIDKGSPTRTKAQLCSDK